MKILRYRHGLEVSYALGATLTFELVKCMPDAVNRVFISSATEKTEEINGLLDDCKRFGIPVEVSDKAFNILSPKGNCFVIGEFRKRDTRLAPGCHLVLVNPSDAGNLGTIVRTAVGFGVTDIAVISPAVDFFDPKAIRASMGAAFHVRVEYFEQMGEYRERFPENLLYAFMLSSSAPITEIDKKEPYSLVFGNEARGLPGEYAVFCRSVVIRHSQDIDSLSLPVAAGIAMYEFTRERWKI